MNLQLIFATIPTSTICFMDGVHPTHNVQPAYGWIQKGIRKEVPANSGRSRINLSGILDVISHKVLIQEDKMLNAEATIGFFRKIEAAYSGKKRYISFAITPGTTGIRL